MGNGSSDSNWKVCQKPARDYLRCSEYLSDIASTLIACRAGIEQATGNYISFFDADDSYENQYSLAHMLQTIE